jgi:hypothetical protein
VSPVVTFNNWPAPNELVPASETLAALLAFAPRHDDGASHSHPVFLLDSWRLAYRFDTPDEDTFDNRYMLTESDLPDAAALRASGINRVVYVVESLDDTEVEEDDLHAIFEAYQAAGITIHIVDLSWLSHARPVSVWPDELLASTSLRVEPRRTLVDDPVFFDRARGGFGGVHGRPSPGLGFSGAFGGGGRGG